MSTSDKRSKTINRFWNLREALVRAALWITPDGFHPAVSIMRDFRRKFGRYPRIFSAKTFNEKVQARKILDRRRQLSVWADKHAVRDYVEAKLGPAVLPRLYHVTVDPSDIPFNKLPLKYVVKASHGSGWVQVVTDGANVDREKLIDRCRDWLSLNYYDLTKEWEYKDIPPRILVEEFLDPGTGAPPSDFKFFVFGGKTKFVQVDVDRHTDHKRNFYDTRWNKLDCRLVYRNFESDLPKPGTLETMIDYAQILSDGIGFVRVDLYDVRGKVYFGEMTATPENGLGEFMPPSWDSTFGEFWNTEWLLFRRQFPHAILGHFD